MTRAWGGEIFVAFPDRKDICYRCAFRKQIEASIAEERRNHMYMDLEDAATVKFEAGLDVDIEYGVSIGSKIMLDILNRDNPDYHPRILHTLSQFTVFSGTADRSGADPFWNRIFTKPLDYVPIGIAEGSRREDCEFCSHG
jgi:hypothetical protein